MDYTEEELADLAEMRELRLRLRACAIAKVAECEAFEAAKTTLELNRQIRAIDGADRLVTVLYTPRRPTRRALSAAKAQSKSKAPPIDPETGKPETTYEDIIAVGNLILKADKAITNAKYIRPMKDRPAPAACADDKAESRRFDRMEMTNEILDILTATLPTPEWFDKKMAADKPETIPSPVAAAPAIEAPVAAPETFDNAQGTDFYRRMVDQCAFCLRTWPDESALAWDNLDWENHSLSDGVRLPKGSEADRRVYLDASILMACNTIARHASLKTGKRIDGGPRGGNDPDAWTFSAHYGTAVTHRADGEIAGPPGLPWWLVQRPPP